MRFDGPVSSPESPGRTGESRWPMLSAVVAIGVLTASYLIARAERERIRAINKARSEGG